MSALGVIAAGSHESRDAGAHALLSGGNAIDAAVAGAFATAAGDPAITSLAGGGVLVFRPAAGDAEVCDFFVDAPGLGGQRFTGGLDGGLPPLDFEEIEIDFGAGGAKQRFRTGRGSAAVPGAIPGLVAALERWGRLDLREVLEPTVRRLHDGVVLTDYQASCFPVLEPILRHSREGRRMFLDEGGRLLGGGGVYRNPELAETLERLGRDGLAAVYQDDLCARFCSEFGEGRGGWITPQDVGAWRPRFGPALRAKIGGVEVATSPAPAAGGSFVLLTLELFRALKVTARAPASPERYRRLVAVFRAIAELRSRDPGFVFAEDATARATRRAAELLDRRAGTPTDREPGGAGNTTHVSVIDHEGNAAAVTISHGEGNGFWVGGLHMNNMLGEEDLFPAGFHRFTPGTRLSTMMAPTIVVDGSGRTFALGSGGSNRIRTAIPQVIAALIDDGEDDAAAVDRGRLHYEAGLLSAEVHALPGQEAALTTAAELARETRSFTGPSLFFGGVHVARRSPDGTLGGAGDPRRGGVVRVVTR